MNSKVFLLTLPSTGSLGSAFTSWDVSRCSRHRRDEKPRQTKNLSKQLKQRHPGNDDNSSLCWERDLVPASVFGRVCLTSCQINIYSQIYLFAFVIENSCGLFFWCVCVCARCFVPLAYFWLLSAGERGCHSLSWLQPFQLLLLTRGFEPLL